MTIHILREEFKSVFICDKCGNVAETDRPDGVIPSGWLTGQLWIDESLSFQRQTPICFCESCQADILGADRLLVVPAVTVEPEPEPEPEPESEPEPEPEGADE